MLSLSLPLLLLWSGFLPLVFVKSKFSEIFFNRWILLIRKLWLQHRIIHSSAAWCMENSTPPRRDRRLRCVTQIMGKKLSEFSLFYGCVWWGEQEKSACFVSQWRVGSGCNGVKIHLRKWGDALSWAILSGCVRETRFLYVMSVRGIQACEMLMRYLTYPRTLPFDQTDLPPSWLLEVETYRRKWVSPEEFHQIVERKLDVPLSLKCVALSNSICSPGLLEVGACDVSGETQGCKWGEVTPQRHSIAPAHPEHNQITIQSLPSISFQISLNFHLLLLDERDIDPDKSGKKKLVLTAFLPRFERPVTVDWKTMLNSGRRAALFRWG